MKSLFFNVIVWVQRMIELVIGWIIGRRYCPVCEKRIFHFLTLPEYYSRNLQRYGHPYQSDDYETINVEEYFCPICQASDRDRMYALFLKKHITNLPSDQHLDILDIAPSQSLSQLIQRLAKASNKVRTYRTADLEMKRADDHIDIMNMSCYDQDQFNFFICSHVLEHVLDDRRALSELYRVLGPEGSGILMVPINLKITSIDEEPLETDPCERWRRFGQDNHVRLYSKQGFQERVLATGFKIYSYDMNFFGEAVFRQAGINPKSVLYVVGK